MRSVLKWLGIVLGGVTLLLVLGAGGIYVESSRMLSAHMTVPDDRIAIPTDSASMARGQHLFVAIGKCAQCHGENLAGATIIDDPAFGRWIGPNLTRGRGGVGGTLTDADWIRAIRHGLGPDGHKLIVMPSEDFNLFSAEDVGAIIAWAKTVPPVDTEQPRPSFGPIGRALIALRQVPVLSADRIDHSKAPPPAVAPGPTREYGDYITHTGGCATCHGATFAGGKVVGGDPSWPPAANLTPTGLQAYSESTFVRTLRTGIRPGGAPLNSAMPWRLAGQMTDDEMHAVWLYLQSLPPREFGER